MTNQIIGLCGLIGSGKDTVAKYLIEKHNFRKFSFASKLKDIVSILFCWDRNLLEGLTEESRLFRETKDIWWTTKLNFKNRSNNEVISITPRFVLQFYGTDLFRKKFHDDFWVYSLEKELSKYNNEKIVITDCRFNNELNMLAEKNANIYQINRSNKLPDWYHLATLLNKNINWTGIIEEYLQGLNIHPSEYSWIGNSNINDSINNFSTLDKLYEEVELKIIQKNKS